MTRPRAVCERDGCEERAAASAYSLLLCMTCFRELGFASPRLLGGRPQPEALDDEKGANR